MGSYGLSAMTYIGGGGGSVKDGERKLVFKHKLKTPGIVHEISMH